MEEDIEITHQRAKRACGYEGCDESMPCFGDAGDLCREAIILYSELAKNERENK